MAVDAPPGMQQWIRDTDRALQDIRMKQQRLDSSINNIPSVPRTVAATETSTVSSPSTATSDWQVITANTPTVRVSTDTGRIKVTLSAHIEGVWVSGGDADAYGAMIMTIDGVRITDYLAEAKLGLMSGFTYLAGQPAGVGEGKAYTRMLNLGVGAYTLRTAYVFNNFTPGISMQWSNRTIIAEPV